MDWPISCIKSQSSETSLYFILFNIILIVLELLNFQNLKLFFLTFRKHIFSSCTLLLLQSSNIFYSLPTPKFMTDHFIVITSSPKSLIEHRHSYTLWKPTSKNQPTVYLLFTWWLNENSQNFHNHMNNWFYKLFSNVCWRFNMASQRFYFSNLIVIPLISASWSRYVSHYMSSFLIWQQSASSVSPFNAELTSWNSTS